MSNVKVALYVRLDAKPGKEEAVAQFLAKGLEMANQEQTTPVWFALRMGPATFGIFDCFADESGREAHLNGPIAKALMANAGELLANPPAIQKVDVLGAKLSGLAVCLVPPLGGRDPWNTRPLRILARLLRVEKI